MNKQETAAALKLVLRKEHLENMSAMFHSHMILLLKAIYATYNISHIYTPQTPRIILKKVEFALKTIQRIYCFGTYLVGKKIKAYYIKIIWNE